MNIYFSRHARRQMMWRDIKEEEVRRVVMSPEKAEDSIKGRKNLRAVVGNRLLQVTIKEEPTRVVIVTVIDKTR